MLIISNIIGLCAVALFVFSYQQKKRKNIIIFNVISRVLYIVQYCLLGAFSGAVLDVLGVVASLIAGKKHLPFFKKHIKAIVIVLDLVIVVVGLLFYENIFSLCPIFGVLFHTGDFFISDEKKIRVVSLIGSPFWLVYNTVSFAFGSAIGDIITIVSILTAMIKYDIFPKRKCKKEIEEVKNK